ncbi:hypothetical protein, partial [Bradyrhizobium sp. NBAIM08]|uniref:hypothetical protein n=1 Tax=Bradyrhizobium sp. NBAIM08 TaxID=2793815 RepID=UPI001CD67CD6
RRGIRSAVGRAHHENIIGFSNEDDLDAIQLELVGIENALAGVLNRINALDAQANTYRQHATAYAAIATYKWEQVDITSIEARIDGLRKRQAELLGSDNRLQGLQKQIDDLKEMHRLSQEEDAELRNTAKALK